MSALSGAGMDDFFEAVNGATAEYKEFYLPDLERMQAVRDLDQPVQTVIAQTSHCCRLCSWAAVLRLRHGM